jgi:Tol biopolymer transport system component
MRTKRNEQLTYGPGDKTDPCWSPCGNWVAFGLEMQGTHSIMLLHIKTGRIVPLHHSREDCRYPTWSP